MNGLLFTYALTYGGAIVSLCNPFYGLLIYICFAIVKPPALWPWCVPVGNYSRVIGIALLVGWALNGFGDVKLGRAKPIVICLCGYFVWVLVSSVLSEDPSRGMPFVEYLLKIVLPFVAGITLIRTWQQVWQLAWVVLFSCAFLAYETNLAYLGGVNIERDGFFKLDNNSFSILIVTGFGLPLILGIRREKPHTAGFLPRHCRRHGARADACHVSRRNARHHRGDSLRSRRHSQNTRHLDYDSRGRRNRRSTGRSTGDPRV
jgi:hypothetical protein